MSALNILLKCLMALNLCVGVQSSNEMNFSIEFVVDCIYNFIKILKLLFVRLEINISSKIANNDK